jgi:hypothetical protein
MRLATSSCNPACQERRNIAHCFTARSRADAFCHKRMQTRMAGGSHHTDIDQRSEQSQKCRLNHGCSERASFFDFHIKSNISNRAFATVLCAFCRPHLLKMLRACSEMLFFDQD